jgi:hypothetical protein
MKKYIKNGDNKMIIKTIVPKFGEPMHYIGKPVKDKDGNRIGGIVDAVLNGDCVEISMEIPNVYTGDELMMKIRTGLGV